MNAPKGEETIFGAALRLPVSERADYIARSTKGNPELRQRLEALLANYDAATFLDQAAASELRKTLISLPLTEKTGDTIGRYKLLQQIGEGGCGVVYMAEQTEPVRRRVALKIIKLGMDTRSVIARFEAERQALALMDHPNIAKVLDAGATDTGRPYFVMELVRGLKITEYCDKKQLPTRERLDLFMQVCHAIQHAHQKGIIHRDIKPSNILVSVNDGLPIPKVIDFGIAKATTGQQLTDKTLFTAFEQFIGTPAYMSPEQALVTSLDVDTRSDIYALGVLLYELLTGKTPFDVSELLAIGLDEMRRAICEREPPKPSTRLSTLPGEELSTTAQRRGLDAPKLVSELRGDLDWIVMKALEKDRARRYETANSLAADVQRHLNNEPVVACPPSRLYRLKKTFQRHKLAFAAGGAVAASLVIGFSLATVSFYRERAARSRADEQAAIAKSVNDFLLEDILGQADSLIQAEAQFTPNPNLTVREALDRAAERIDRFKNQPLQEAAVRLAIGKALIGVGEAEPAVAHLQRALALRQAKLMANHPDTLRTMFSLARAYQVTEKLNEFVSLIQETLKLQRETLGSDDPDTLRSMNLLANAYEKLGKLGQTLPLREEMLERTQARFGPDDGLTLVAMGNLAGSYKAAGKPDRARLLYEDAVKLARVRLRTGHPFVSHLIANLATTYSEAGEFEKALSLSDEALKLAQINRGPNHPETLNAMQTVIDVYYRAGKYLEALPIMEELVRLETAKYGADHPNTWKAMCNLSVAYLGTGKLKQAVKVREELLNIAEAKHGMGHPDTLGPMGDLAIVWRAARRFDEALPLLEKMVKLHQKKFGQDDPKTLRWMNELGTTYWTAGKLDQALRRFQEVLPLNQKTWGADDPKTLMALHSLAWIHFESGQRDQGLLLLEEKFNRIEAKCGPDDRATLNEISALAQAYAQAGKFDRALMLQKQALERTKTKFGPQSRETLLCMGQLGSTYDQAGKLDQALPLLEQTVTLIKTNSAANDSETLDIMRSLAAVYLELRRPDLAVPLSEETFKLRESKLGSDHADTLGSMGDHIEFLISARNYTEAEHWSRQLSTALRQHKDPSLAAARALASTGQNLLARQQWAKAEQVGRDYLAICEKAQPEGWEAFSARSLLGGALLGQGKIRDARPLVVAGYDGLKKQSQTKVSLDNSEKDDLHGAMDRLETLYDLCQDDPDSGPWKAEIERVRKIGDSGAIRHWLIVSPIPLAPDESPVSALEQEQLQSEADLRPGPEDKVSVGSRNFIWREYHLRDYAMNFNRLLGEETCWSVAYAVCYVQTSTPREGLLLKAGSDDQARVYLNGQKIYENTRPRALALDEDTISNVNLHAGLNVIVFKVVNGGGSWGGSLRFADKDDHPVQGITITLNPINP